MTRADKFEEIFGYRPATDQVLCNEHDWCGENDACNYCTSNKYNIGREEDWWNAEYKENDMAKVYTNANVGDLRERFVNAVTEVFEDSEKFLDYIENEEYESSFYDVFYSGSGECYIINRSSGEYINWYKFTHIGRDIHSTVAPDDFWEFLSDFGFLKGE